jgi:DNA-binding response OmpR family regulator
MRTAVQSAIQRGRTQEQKLLEATWSGQQLLNTGTAMAAAGLTSSDRLPSILIGEDAVLIGMALESYLEDQGFSCDVVCSSAEAQRWLSENTPSAAILDYQLKDGPCTTLATVLRARGVPLLIYSGYPAEAACPELRGTTWINKPADRETLLHAVSSLAAPSNKQGNL